MRQEEHSGARYIVPLGAFLDMTLGAGAALTVGPAVHVAGVVAGIRWPTSNLWPTWLIVAVVIASALRLLSRRVGIAARIGVAVGLAALGAGALAALTRLRVEQLLS